MEKKLSVADDAVAAVVAREREGQRRQSGRERPRTRPWKGRLDSR